MQQERRKKSKWGIALQGEGIGWFVNLEMN